MTYDSNDKEDPRKLPEIVDAHRDVISAGTALPEETSSTEDFVRPYEDTVARDTAHVLRIIKSTKAVKKVNARYATNGPGTAPN